MSSPTMIRCALIHNDTILKTVITYYEPGYGFTASFQAYNVENDNNLLLVSSQWSDERDAIKEFEQYV